MKKEKKDVASQVRSDVTLLEENKQLKEKCAALVSSGEEMGKEIATLKKSNAGLKGHNGILNGKLTDAEKEVARLKALCKEGDELNESRISEIENLNAVIAEKEKAIAGLQSQVCELKHKVTEAEETARAEKLRSSELEDSLEYEKLPWWKKIF